MALNVSILEQGFLGLTRHPPLSVPEYANRMASFYELFALTATPLPVIAGRRALLEQALIGTSQPPRTGSMSKVISGFNSGLSAFWIGVVVPGGAVTAFLGTPALRAGLSSINNKMSTAQATRIYAQAFAAATRLVQYVIPPGPPLFLV